MSIPLEMADAFNYTVAPVFDFLEIVASSLGWYGQALALAVFVAVGLFLWNIFKGVFR